MDAIAAIDRELGLAQYEAQLPAVIKRTLADYRAKARKNPTQLASYRAYVERCVRQCEAESEMDGATASTLFIENIACWRIELEIAEHEAGRWPRDCEEWCAKHLPQEFAEVQIAMKAVCERATSRTLEHLNVAYRAMLEAYVRAV